MASRSVGDIIIAMLRLRVDKLVRISTGLALLLLLAAEEKVCTWLYTPPADPVAARAEGEAPGPVSATDTGSKPGEQDKPPPEPLSLVAVLPDAVPVRRAGRLSRAALADTVGARAGAVACGPLNAAHGNGKDTAALAGPLPPWLDGFPPSALDGTVPTNDRNLPVRDPSLTTTLMKTGPPRA